MDLRAIQTANLVLSMPLLFDLIVDRFAFFRVVIAMDLVLHRTATMAQHAHDLLLVVINCLSAACLSFLQRMVDGRGDLRCQHFVSYWMRLHRLYLEIRWRYCKVAKLG